MSRANANENSNSDSQKRYEHVRTLGNGSFGVVYEAIAVSTGENVAIKKVLQDPRYKNRELDVMKQLSHPNVVTLKDYFYTVQSDDKDKNPQRYLSVVMEYVPQTLYKCVKMHSRNGQEFPYIRVLLCTYQLLRSLGYVHSLGLCHRDIKPQNVLVDPDTYVLKLCDFGSAKRLHPAESSVAYICSRYYRAPELMLGATKYTCAIDVWSAGCVVGEMLQARPLFAGHTSVDQLVKILAGRGSPTPNEINDMNPDYETMQFPPCNKRNIADIIVRSDKIDSRMYDLLDKMLAYSPKKRIHPYVALAHPVFDPLREEGYHLPNGRPLPPLFNFSQHELRQMPDTVRRQVIPRWLSLE